MNVHHWYINVVQQFSVELDRITGRKEHHDLLVFVFLQKSEKQQKTLIGWARDESLFEACRRSHVSFRRHVDKDGIFRIDRESSEIFYLLSLRG